jgi:hypothetical protein
MPVMPQPTAPRDPNQTSPEEFSIKIGLFDEGDCEETHRIVPLARYLNELHDLPTHQR